MHALLWRVLLGLALLISASATYAGEPTLRLASLEWAPYVGRQLPSEGLTSAIVKAAAQQAGLNTEIAYFPWSRVLAEGLRNPEYAGYFPSFYLKEREKTCYFSNPIGTSIIGFASLRNKHFQWQQLADLHAYRIGIVQDYANGEEFDSLVKNHLLNTDAAPSDISNLRKLLANRVDVVVIDKYVLKQLLISAPEFRDVKDELVFNAHELTHFSMRICFQRNAAGLALQKQFDSGLARQNLRQLEADYFSQYSRLSVAPATVRP